MLVFGLVLPLGSTRLGGTVPSAFSTRKPESPPDITVPTRPGISLTFTAIVATRLVDTANTVREIPECAPMVRAIDVSGLGMPFTLVWNLDDTGLGATSWQDAAMPLTGRSGI